MKFLAVILSTLMLVACGGGGGGGEAGSGSPPAGPVAPVFSFPFKSAFISSLSSGSIRDIAITGSCSGSGRAITAPAVMATDFEGVAALAVTWTMKMSLSGCNPSSINQSGISYIDKNFSPLGSSIVGGNYAVYQTPPPLPTSVSVGDIGTYGTQVLYTNSTKATKSGSIVQSYVVESESSTTAILNLISKLYDAAGILTATEQDRYRIAMTGPVLRIWDDVQYANGLHLVLNYSYPSPTAITITPSTVSVLIGSSTTLAAIGTYTNGDTVNLSNQVNWTSSDTAVATVNSEGLVNSVSTGSTNIITSGLGMTSSIAVLTVIPPPPPTGVFAVSQNGQVAVSWMPIVGAKSYSIYWGTTPGVTNGSNRIDIAAPPYTQTGLLPGSTYYYRVGSVYAGGESLSEESFAFLYTGGNPVGHFTATGRMAQARYSHTATLLRNGKVLVAGGYSYSTSTGSTASTAGAEIYDPATGSFSTTGSMTEARSSHTATLLLNGKVLIIGSFSAEIYDPATGSFTATGSMARARGVHTATRLSNGKVLITGGTTVSNGYAEVAITEIYDPATASFTYAASLSTGNAAPNAVLLSNGNVLISGGYGGNRRSSRAEVFDPSSGSFAASGGMSIARMSHTGTLLPNGTVLVSGGETASPQDANWVSGVTSAELYNPTFVGAGWTGGFSPTGSMTQARYSHTATLLSNGKVLMTGGASDRSLNRSSAEIYDSTSGLFTPTSNMGSGRYFHTATLLPNGQVLVVGGVGGAIGENSTLASAELFQ